MKQKKFRFEESYKHHYAKIALGSLIYKGFKNLNPIKIIFEYRFHQNGFIIFVPDVVVFDENGICALFEIVHRNPVSDKKWNIMFDYFDDQGYIPKIFEIDAEEILCKLL
jgi:hypothetical protein